MRLEMATFPVARIQFDSRTSYDMGNLTVSRDELSRLVLEDPRVTAVSFEAVHPGEKARITDVRDVVEPRVKIKGPGTVFPGFLGPPHTVGAGVTHRLAQMAVVSSAVIPSTTTTGTQVPRASFLDTWGPGARTQVSTCALLVMMLDLAPGLTDLDYLYAILSAELRVARRLAEATAQIHPDSTEVFEIGEVDPKLPRVAFVQGLLTTAHQLYPGASYYGMPLRESMPIWVHPNEVLDGAVLTDATQSSGIAPSTWHWQNHPIVLDLYREHGRRFNFRGVILERIRFETMDGKIRTAEQTTKLLQAMGVHGAILAWMRAGNAFMDVQMTVETCEKAGIRTVVVTYEWGGEDGQGPPLLFVVPEAQGMVSTGNSHRFKSQGLLKLPAPERVVGRSKEIPVDFVPGAAKIDASKEMEFDILMGPIFGGVDLWGAGTRTCREF